MRTGSFRARLAIRFTALMAAMFIAIGAVALLLLRQILTSQLDGTLLRLASIEASAVSDSPDSAVHFHEGIFNAPRSEHTAELVRYAEVWHEDGSPVVRSQSLGRQDLPITRAVFAAAKRGEIVVLTLHQGHFHRARSFSKGGAQNDPRDERSTEFSSSGTPSAHLSPNWLWRHELQCSTGLLVLCRSGGSARTRRRPAMSVVPFGQADSHRRQRQCLGLRSRHIVKLPR